MKTKIYGGSGKYTRQEIISLIDSMQVKKMTYIWYTPKGEFNARDGIDCRHTKRDTLQTVEVYDFLRKYSKARSFSFSCVTIADIEKKEEEEKKIQEILKWEKDNHHTIKVGTHGGKITLETVNHRWFPSEYVMTLENGRWSDGYNIGARHGENTGSRAIYIEDLAKALELLRENGCIFDKTV